MSAADSDPRAWRALDCDGKPVVVHVGDGSAWLTVGTETARLDAVTAMRLGGRLNGAGQRALSGIKAARAAQRPANPEG